MGQSRTRATADENAAAFIFATERPKTGQSMNRLKEFVWYHIHGDCEANGLVLRKYVDMKHLTAQDRLDLAFFYTLTYSVPTAVLLLGKRDRFARAEPEELNRMKDTLFFQSDRKYMAMRDCFAKSIAEWNRTIRGCAPSLTFALTRYGMLRDTALQTVEGWYGVGRYAACLFLETFCALNDCQANPKIDEQFESGNVFTAGIFNVFGNDRAADRIDKHGAKPEDEEPARKRLAAIRAAVRAAGGEDNYYYIETTLCAYRKHFKGTRYNGYYADRQLDEIKRYERSGGNAGLCSDLYRARRQAMPPQYLGEIGGWSGIRPELKKSYLNGRGIIGRGKADA